MKKLLLFTLILFGAGQAMAYNNIVVENWAKFGPDNIKPKMYVNVGYQGGGWCKQDLDVLVNHSESSDISRGACLISSIWARVITDPQSYPVKYQDTNSLSPNGTASHFKVMWDATTNSFKIEEIG